MIYNKEYNIYLNGENGEFTIEKRKIIFYDGYDNYNLKGVNLLFKLY
jgi:hypothetical protein